MRILVFILTVPFGILCFFSSFQSIIDSFPRIGINHYFFLGGTFFSIFLLIRYQKKFEFYSTFEHELTHNIWAMLFFKKPVGFQVKSDGTGLFQWTGSKKFSSIFILLAPYFFPTACFLWLPFHVMCKEDYYWFYFTLMGIFFGYHLTSTYQEIGSHQSDITTNGVFYSYTIIFSLFIVYHGIIISHLNNGFQGVLDFLLFNNVQLIKSLFGLF